ncbi:MAG: RNA methyltransferase, partial [Chitinophagaceae bacterium]
MLSKASIKYIQSLQHKKFRDQEGLFVAEGPKLVKELLEHGVFQCKALYAMPAWLQQEPALAASYAAIAEELKDFELEKISSLSKPNQVLAVFQKKAPVENPVLQNKLTILLDDIQDPGNLGTIIRIADWFKVENVICSLHTADMYNSKVVQSTMASLQRVNLIYTDTLEWLKKNNAVNI